MLKSEKDAKSSQKVLKAHRSARCALNSRLKPEISVKYVKKTSIILDKAVYFLCRLGTNGIY